MYAKHTTYFISTMVCFQTTHLEKEVFILFKAMGRSQAKPHRNVITGPTTSWVCKLQHNRGDLVFNNHLSNRKQSWILLDRGVLILFMKWQKSKIRKQFARTVQGMVGWHWNELQTSIQTHQKSVWFGFVSRQSRKCRQSDWGPLTGVFRQERPGGVGGCLWRGIVQDQ